MKKCQVETRRGLERFTLQSATCLQRAHSLQRPRCNSWEQNSIMMSVPCVCTIGLITSSFSSSRLTATNLECQPSFLSFSQQSKLPFIWDLNQSNIWKWGISGAMHFSKKRKAHYSCLFNKQHLICATDQTLPNLLCPRSTHIEIQLIFILITWRHCKIPSCLLNHKNGKQSWHLSNTYYLLDIFTGTITFLST